MTTRSLAQIAVFSGLIAFGTAILSTSFLAIPIPPPLYEITAAPAFYFAISVLYSRKVSFWSTPIGPAVGEALNVFVKILTVENPITIRDTIRARPPHRQIISYSRNQS